MLLTVEIPWLTSCDLGLRTPCEPTLNAFKAGSHVVPSHLSSIRVILAVESMEVGTYHFTWGPKYDIDAHMTAIFGGEAPDLS